MPNQAHQFLNTPASPPPSPYEALADEYYDQLKHPTCRNFRDGSMELIRSELSNMVSPKFAIEVGCGKSVIGELAAQGFFKASRLVLTDSSPSMLAYSAPFSQVGAEFVLTEAHAIPAATSTVDLIVSSLGDPYNEEKFWKEVRRCLSVGGRCLFTTPSFGWAAEFRATSRNERDAVAYFELANGLRRVYVPSFIYEPDKQIKMIQRHGLVVEEVRSISSDLLPPPLSQKLVLDSGTPDPITCFRILG